MAFPSIQTQNGAVVPRTSTIGVTWELGPSAYPMSPSVLNVLPSWSAGTFRSNDLEPCSSRYLLPYYFSFYISLVAKDVIPNVYSGDVLRYSFLISRLKGSRGIYLRWQNSGRWYPCVGSDGEWGMRDAEGGDCWQHPVLGVSESVQLVIIHWISHPRYVHFWY